MPQNGLKWLLRWGTTERSIGARNRTAICSARKMASKQKKQSVMGIENFVRSVLNLVHHVRRRHVYEMPNKIYYDFFFVEHYV